MADEERVRYSVRIHGHVQGVSFRASVADAARRHDVHGWVRNHRDGSVEAAFEGQPSVVDQMVEFCRHGPPGARVTRLDTHAEQLHGERTFAVL